MLAKELVRFEVNQPITGLSESLDCCASSYLACYQTVLDYQTNPMAKEKLQCGWRDYSMPAGTIVKHAITGV